MKKLLSVNVTSIIHYEEWSGSVGKTGIDKRPKLGRVAIENDGVEGDFGLEPEETSAIGKNLEHLRAQFSLAEDEARSPLDDSAGFGEDLPLDHFPGGILSGRLARTCRAEQERLDSRANSGTIRPRQPISEQPGGEDPRVVQDNSVAGLKQIGEVSELVIRPLTRGSVDDQHPGSIPLHKWFLGDQLRGQRKVKIAQLHAQRPIFPRGTGSFFREAPVIGGGVMASGEAVPDGDRRGGARPGRVASD